MRLVTGKELCALIGVKTLASLTRAEKMGRIKSIMQDGKKMYDADTAVGEYLNNRTESAIKHSLREPQVSEDVSEADGLLTISDADRLKKTYEGRLAKVKYETEIGKLVPIDEVAQVVENEYALVRTRLRAIASKLAPVVALEDNEKKCRQLISDAVEDCLKELSGYGGK